MPLGLAAHSFRTHGQTPSRPDSRRDGSRRPSGSCATVVGHVSPDKMTSGQCGTQTQFSGQDGGTDDARKLTSVISRVGGVGATNTEEIQHGGLSLQDRTAADGADFNRRHGHGDLKVTIGTERKTIVSIQIQTCRTGQTTYFLIVVIQLLLSTFWAGS